MLIDITKHLKKEIVGIIQVGAHHGNEYQFLKNISENILMFEPQKEAYDILCNSFKDEKLLKIKNVAVGSENKKMMMFKETANQGQSSSLLLPVLHLIQYPHINFTSSEVVDVVTLNTYFENEEISYNILMVDVQGFELEVFRGATSILEKIDYILCEVNRAELYKGCPMVEEIDEFLNSYNFKRTDTSWDGHTWGDAFYEKQ